MSESERSRRWRLVLGEPDETAPALAGIDLERDRVLAALYEQGGGLGGDDQPDQRRGGLERSAPRAARWLGDVRKYFPTGVVRVMQRDAVQRLGLGRLLLEPELLEVAEPDINLVATLMSLRGVIPEHSRATARIVVRKVVDDLERRLSQPTRTTITGAVNRAARTRRPRRPSEIDWDRTIRANLHPFHKVREKGGSAERVRTSLKFYQPKPPTSGARATPRNASPAWAERTVWNVSR